MNLARAAATAAFTLASTASLAFPEYTAIALGPNGASGTARDVNRDGTVVGCYRRDGAATMNAFSWKEGRLTELGPGCAEAINNRGVVAGIDAKGNVVVWTSTRPTPLGFAGDVTGINDAGTLVGSSQTADKRNHPWMYANGQRTELPDAGSATGATANGINNAGQVIINANGSGYVYKDGQMTPIPGIGDSGLSLPNAINDAGTVVGGSSSHGPAPYIFHAGATRYLPGGAGYSYAVGLNNAGLALGSGEGIYGYVVEADGTSHPLSSLAGPTWSHLEGEAINDNGWIVGSGNGPSTTGQPFLLVPNSASLHHAAQRRER